MKRVATLLLSLFILLAALCATDVSFLVPAEITNYSYDKSVNQQINDNKTVSLTLSDSDIISFTTANNKAFDAKLVTTAESNINATFSWTIANSNTKLRYSLNNSKPKTIKNDINEITIKNISSNELSIFTLEAKVNKKWIECGRVGLIPVNLIEEEQTQKQEELIEPVVNENSSINTLEPKLISNKEKKISIRLTASPYSIGIYDFFNGHNIPDARYLTITNYGLSADGEVGYQVNNNILIYLGAGYGYQMKKETIIPNAFKVSYFKAYVGLDLRFIKVSKFSSSLGVFAGGMMGINAGQYNISSILGGRIRFDYYLNSHLSLGLQTRFTASYLPANDPLYKSMTYLIDPLTLSLDVRF